MKNKAKLWFMFAAVWLIVLFPGAAVRAANASNYYGSQLSGAAKVIYKKLTAVDWNETDSITIELPASYTWSSSEDLDEKIMEPVAEAFSLDQYEYYEFLAFTQYYSYEIRDDGSQSCTEFQFERTDYITRSAAQEKLINQALSKAYQKINAQRESSSRYDTVKAIHDYVAGLVSYNSGKPQYQTVAGALLAKYGNQASCEGYSRLFRTICLHYNIPCVLVKGYGSSYRSASDPVYQSNHMWNLVRMEDGKWYLVDVTWDDQSTIEYNYFLAGSGSEGFRTTVGVDHVPFLSSSDLKVPTLASSGYKAQSGSESSAPARVGALKAKNIKTTSAKVSFSSVSGADGYQAYVSTSSGFSGSVKKFRSASNSISLTGLKSGKTYYVKVRAYKKYSGKTVYGKFSSVKKITLKKASTPKLSAAKKTLTVGRSVTLKVTGTSASVKWSSSKPSVATVKNGKVTAKKAGTTKITPVVSGKKLVCTITVRAK